MPLTVEYFDQLSFKASSSSFVNCCDTVRPLASAPLFASVLAVAILLTSPVARAGMGGAPSFNDSGTIPYLVMILEKRNKTV